MEKIFYTVLMFVLALFIVVIGIGLFNNQTPFVKEIETDELKFSRQIGKTIVIQKDTLTVVNYIFLDRRYQFILSNGLRVNESLIINKKP